MSSAASGFTTIDAYIASCPEEVRGTLEEIRQAIRAEAPEATEAITYNMPTFQLHGNLIHFADWKRHISLYPITGETEASIEELSRYTTSGKGTIQFSLGQPILLPLVRRIVACRVAENMRNRSPV